MNFLNILSNSSFLNLSDISKKLQDDNTNIIYLFFPMISGYITSAFCPMNRNDGANIKFRPPSYVFGIVWPILYLLLGAAWVLSNSKTLYYLVLSLILCLWIIVFSCFKDKKSASWILLASVTMCTSVIVVSSKKSQLLLTPLLGWLLFALLMNTMDVQLSL